MSDPYKKAAPGQPANWPASAYNAMLDAAEAHRRQRLPGGPPERDDDRLVSTPPAGMLLRIYNDTGTDLPRASVVGLGDPVFPPGDALDAFLRGPLTWQGVVPTSAHAFRFAVLLDAIPAGQVGRAWAAGAYQVKVDLTDESHTCAVATEGITSHLVSAPVGPAQILWRESEQESYGDPIGVQWAIVRQAAGCGSVSGPCLPPTVSVCVSNCSDTPISTFTATLKLGEDTIDTCSPTSPSNCCTLTGTVAGTYTIEVTSSTVGSIFTRALACGQDAIYTITGQTCLVCLQSVSPLTAVTPFGSISLTWDGVNSLRGTITVPGCDVYRTTVIDSAWENASTECPDPNDTDDVDVEIRLFCIGNDRVRVQAQWGQTCLRCPGPNSGIVVRYETFLGSETCNPLFSDRILTVGFSVFSEIIDLGGPDCIWCDALEGETLGFMLDLSKLGKGSIPIDISGF